MLSTAVKFRQYFSIFVLYLRTALCLLAIVLLTAKRFSAFTQYPYEKRTLTAIWNEGLTKIGYADDFNIR